MTKRTNTLSRRTLLKLGAAATLLPARAFAEAESLRIGFLTVKTGPLAAGGKQQEEGVELFLKERKASLAGRAVEVTTQDTAGNPATAKVKTQELVERYKVDVMIGPLATNEALAMDDYVRESEVPLITTTSTASLDLKARKVNPWVLHAFGTAPQVTHPLGHYAARTLGYKRIATLADDFTYGHEGTSGLQRTFEDNGGRVVQKLWPPLNVPDYGPYIAQIEQNIDALYIGFAGINGLRFLKQFSEYGLKGKIPVLGNTTSTDEGILRNMGDEALGVVTAGWYAAGIETADNGKFVAAIRESYAHDPGFYTAGPYTALLIIEAALRATGGETDDKRALLKALHEVRLTSGPLGKIRLDNYGNPILDIHIRKVERREGRLVNAIIYTYPEVSQFWTYDPKKFLAEPVYSRNYPPARYLE
ncbi:MAG: ABC transporter substrate-binding protein [Alphaproteobacteria bacterium]